jgi:filamentous hemagglutinin family protein
MRTHPNKQQTQQAKSCSHRLRPLLSHMLEKGLLAGTLVTGQLLLAPLAHAGPEGGAVVSGQGTITKVNSLDTHINQQSQNLLMNFDSFDLSKDESVLITQPNAAAWFVGQVVGGSPTAIFGSITANGQVALVNPRGVIFGETASINAAGVFASAMGLTNQDLFQKEGAIFEAESGVGGYVINHGVINASVGGSVTLLGESVTNTGVIVATLGQVHLATGSKAVVNFGPDQLIGIEVTQEVLENNDSLKAALTNTGTIDAAGGTVMLTSSVSKSLFDYAINNEGVVRAKDAEYKDGVIKLFGSGSSVLNTGTLDASSEASGVRGGQVTITSDSAVLMAGSGNIKATSADGLGGQVQIDANSVALNDAASIDVSGARGGGDVVINGGASALVDSGSEIRADALAAGDGGQISINAQAINIAGELSARGGAESGGGGRIALSATDVLSVSGSLDVGADNGVNGSVNLSAPSVSISDDGAGGSVNLAGVNGDIEINAASRVEVNSVLSDILDLGDSSLTISVDGVASTNAESEAVAFVMSDANDTISTTGQITISVSDGSFNANSLIEIAGTLESKPFPEPLPNDPLAPANTISLAANNGRIRVRNTARLLATSHDAHESSVRLIATGYEEGNESGTVYMEGVIDVSNATGTGGSVKVLGDRVALLGDANIHASGDTGGGEVLVGGNYQGSGEELNAIKTFVGSDVLINADAVTRGDGGTVIVWADDTTRYFGSISAGGGSESGDGGFAEVSGKQHLRFSGNVDLPGDANGLLLLDPASITIVGTNGAGSPQDGAADGTNTFAGDPSAVAGTILFADTGPVTVYESELEALGTASIVLQATDGISTSGTFASGISLSGSLTLETSNNAVGTGITIGEAISATSITIRTGTDATPVSAPISVQDLTSTTGGILLESSGDVTLGGAVASTTTIGINSGGTIVQNGAITSATTVDLDAASTIGLNAAISGVSGTVAIDATGTTTIAAAGDISAGGAVTFGAAKAGTLTTSGDVTTTDDDVTFTNAVTLGGAVSIDTGGVAAGNILFSSTVSGDHLLTLTGGTSTITFSGAVGTLSGLKVNSAGQIDFDSTLSVDDQGIDIDAGIVNFDNTVTTTNGGALTATNSGQLTIAAAADMSLDGQFNQDGSGAVSLLGDITTTADNIGFASAVTLGGAVALNSGAGVGTITFGNTLNGSHNLTLTAGSGNIDFDGIVGTTRLGALDIVSATNVTADAGITAQSISQQSGAGLTTFTGALNTNGAAGIDLNGSAFTLANTLTTTGGGSVSITNSGQLTTQNNITSSAQFLQDGTGAVSLGGDVNTATTQRYQSGVTISGNRTLTSGGNMTFDSSIVGANNNLDINAGAAGVISVSGQVSGVNELEVVNSNGTTFSDNVSATTIRLTDTSDGQTIAFNGNVTATTLQTSAQNYNVSLVGASSTITSDTSFINTGATTLGDAASDVIRFVNGLDATSAGGVSIAGTVGTSGQAIDFANVKLAANATIDTTSGSGSVAITGTVAGNSGAENLTIDSGTVTFQNTIDANNLTIEASTVSLNQGVDLSGTLDTTVSSKLTVLGQTLKADGGVTISGATELGSSVVTNNSDVSITGTLTLLENTDVSIATSNGDITVTGSTAGAAGAGNETLTLNAGTGQVSLAGVFGAGSTSNSGGLTDVTVTNSSTVSFGKIDITGALNQSNAATGNTTFNGTTGVGSASLKGTNFSFNGFTSAGAVTIAASGSVTQQSGTKFTSTGNLNVSANSLTFSDLVTGGQVDFNIDNDAVVTHAGNLTLDVDTGRNLTLTNTGSVAITGSIGRDLSITAENNAITSTGITVAGASEYTGQSLDLVTSATGEIVFAVDDDVEIQNDKAIVAEGSATNLSLTATSGTITDSGDLKVTSAAVFKAEGTGGSVTLNNSGNEFGSLDVRSVGAVTVAEQGDSQLAAVSATAFTLNSTGTVTDGANAAISVSGLADITASGDVTLGNEAGDNIQLNSIEISAAGVVINDDSTDGLTVSDVSANTFEVSSGGGISSAANANIIVTNAAVFNASSGASTISLSNSSNAFGSVSLTGSTITIAERDSMSLTQVTASGDFTANVSGEITDVGTVSVTGATTLNAGSQNVILDSAANNFGVINATAGDVEITEAGDSVLGQLSVDQLGLTSTGNVSQSASSELNVSGSATINSGSNNITLLGTANNFGSLSLSGDSISLAEASASRLDQVTANQLSVTSTGNISQNNDRTVNVAGLATLNSGSSDIILSAANNLFGSLNLTGQSVTINENDGTNLAGLNATTASITSAGSILGGGVLTVANAATFSSSGASLTLNNAANALGRLSLTGDVVSVVEAGSVELFSVNAGTSLGVTATTGSITDSTGATLNVTGDVVLNAATNVTLGDSDNDSVQFGVTNITGQQVNFREAGSMAISGLNAANAVLTSSGSISEQTGATVNVADLLTFSAGGDINFDRGQNNFARIDLTTTGNALLSNTRATAIESVSTNGLTLTATGDVSDNGAIVTTGNTTISSTANITLDNEANSLGALSLTGQAVVANSATNVVLNRVVANTAVISTNQAITDSANALIDIDQQATFTARQNITLGASGNTVQFGSVTLSGADVTVAETDAAAILGIDSTNLVYQAGGAILAGGIVNVTDAVSLVADGGSANIELSNAANQFAQLSLDGASITVQNSGATELASVKAVDLTLSSGSNVTDGASGSIAVTGALNIEARNNGSISLGNANNASGNDSVSTGSVSLSGGLITLNQSDDIVFTSLSATDDVSVKSFNGNITADSEATVQLAGTTRVSLETDRNSGVINFIADSAMGDFTATGLNVTVSEVGELMLGTLDAETASLTSTLDIVDRNSSSIQVSGTANFTAGNSVTLGNGLANFGSININAVSANISEDSATVLSGAVLSNNLTLNSVGSVTQNSGASIQVDGTSTINVAGGVITLNGQLGNLDLQASGINLSLTGDSSVFGIVSDTLDVTAQGAFSIADLSEIRVTNQANILADRVTFNQDSINAFGGLDVKTSDTGSIGIFSNIQSSVVQGQATNAEDAFTFASNNISLGATGRDVVVGTIGSATGGSISFSGIDVDGNQTLAGGTSTLTLAGNVTLDTTNGGQSVGNSLNLMADVTGLGDILSSGEGNTTLTVAAGTGSVEVGKLSQNNQINTFTVSSGGNITLNDLFVAGNTVDIKVAGTLQANGQIQDTVGDVSLFTSGGDINLTQNVTSNGVLSLTADAGSLSTSNVSAGSGFNVATSGNVQFGGDVTVNNGDTSIASAAGSVETVGSFASTGTGNVSVKASGPLILGSSVASGGQLSLTSTTGSLTANNPISSTTGLNLSAGTDLSVNSIDVSNGSTNVVAGGNLKFNQNVSTTGSFAAFSLSGGLEQSKNTVINAGAELVISTQAGMKIASLSGGTDVTLSIRETNVATGAAAPLFERVNDPITFGSGATDVSSGSGAISYLSQVASVGTADAGQNFAQRAGGGIFYGLVTGAFFSDDIGTSQVLATAPASVNSSLNLFTDVGSGLGALAGDIFGGDFSSISSSITTSLSGTSNASSNAGQTSAASSSRSTAASQRDDEDEVAEVDAAAFQNLKNYDQNPQGILLPEDQQFAYDDEGSMYYMVTMRTEAGEYERFPLFKVDLTLNSTPEVAAKTFTQNFPPLWAGASIAPFWENGEGADD